MRSLAALLGTLALALALGSLVVGHFVLIPTLGGNDLIDANLARSLAEPLALRCANVVLMACAALAVVVRPWLRHALALSLGLIALAIAGLDRVALLPRMQAAWSRVDLVAGRPVDRVVEAQQLQQLHEGALALLGLVLVAMLAVASFPKLRGAER